MLRNALRLCNVASGLRDGTEESKEWDLLNVSGEMAYEMAYFPC